MRNCDKRGVFRGELGVWKMGLVVGVLHFGVFWGLMVGFDSNDEVFGSKDEVFIGKLGTGKKGEAFGGHEKGPT
jgi:hypothetical protein